MLSSRSHYTCDQLRAAAEDWALRLAQAGLQAGDRLLIWSDNRAEWISAFWGCVLQGVAVVPVDASASLELVTRILNAARPRDTDCGWRRGRHLGR
ncbi:MAG TPA: AMP-binding protein [Vicinamibacterales bacterium]|jgi:long-chain acyl-CoA synthetase|nr:AMP-binding protein [Vicinamibacterales bacterium]